MRVCSYLYMKTLPKDAFNKAEKKLNVSIENIGGTFKYYVPDYSLVGSKQTVKY